MYIFTIILCIHTCKSINEWSLESYPDLDIWRSTSDFIPQQSTSYGTIRIGQIMSAEFDWIFWGRTNDPRNGTYYENFFRVGETASNGKSCNGEGSRYPSFWLTNNRDSMHVSVSSGTTCQPEFTLNPYGDIT
eukprot:120922_1